MQYRPDTKAILQAIQDLLMKEVLPKIEEDELLSYKTLVSWNMLGVVVRELEKEDEFTYEEYKSFQDNFKFSEISFRQFDDFVRLSRVEKINVMKMLNQSLAKEIRNSKEADPKSETWKHIKATLKNNLQISNPRFVT